MHQRGVEHLRGGAGLAGAAQSPFVVFGPGGFEAGAVDGKQDPAVCPPPPPGERFHPLLERGPQGFEQPLVPAPHGGGVAAVGSGGGPPRTEGFEQFACLLEAGGECGCLLPAHEDRGGEQRQGLPEGVAMDEVIQGLEGLSGQFPDGVVELGGIG